MNFDELEEKRERAMALADQLPQGVARRWAFFWLGGILQERDPAALHTLTLKSVHLDRAEGPRRRLILLVLSRQGAAEPAFRPFDPLGHPAASRTHVGVSTAPACFAARALHLIRAPSTVFARRGLCFDAHLRPGSALRLLVLIAHQARILHRGVSARGCPTTSSGSRRGNTRISTTAL